MLSLALAPDRKQGVEVVRLIQGEAESIPAPAASFDVVVSTLVLCSVRDPVAVLNEVHRVLRPGGKYCFIEHVSDTHSSQVLIHSSGSCECKDAPAVVFDCSTNSAFVQYSDL
jgi:ubiquinone/menaquinone biosynthesis C-methylase UbiE